MVDKTPNEERSKRRGYLARRKPGAPRLEPGPDGGLDGECLVAGFATEPGRAQPEKATWYPLPSSSHELTTCGKTRWGQVRCPMDGGEGQGSRQTRHGGQKLALGTWNVTSLRGKEPELMREVERYQLDLVGLTSTHSLSSGAVLLNRGWTLFFS